MLPKLHSNISFFRVLIGWIAFKCVVFWFITFSRTLIIVQERFSSALNVSIYLIFVHMVWWNCFAIKKNFDLWSIFVAQNAKSASLKIAFRWGIVTVAERRFMLLICVFLRWGRITSPSMWWFSAREIRTFSIFNKPINSYLVITYYCCFDIYISRRRL